MGELYKEVYVRTKEGRERYITGPHLITMS
jgi:hypothetical protein